MPGRHSAKQKRQARHVAASERAQGKSPKEAESIGWATVNKKKSIAMPGLISTNPPPPPQPEVKSMKKDKKKLKKMDGGGNTYGSMGEAGIGKAGEQVLSSKPARRGDRRVIGNHVTGQAFRDAHAHAFNTDKKGPVKKLGMREMRVPASERSKSIRVMSLDEYYQSVVKADTVDMQA